MFKWLIAGVILVSITIASQEPDKAAMSANGQHIAPATINSNDVQIRANPKNKKLPLDFTQLPTVLQALILEYVKPGWNPVKTIAVNDPIKDLYFADNGILVIHRDQSFLDANEIKPIFFEPRPAKQITAEAINLLEQHLNNQVDKVPAEEISLSRSRRAGTTTYMSFYFKNYCLKYYSLKDEIHIKKADFLKTIKANFEPTAAIGHGAIALCHREKYIAASFGIRNPIRIWDLETGKLVKEFESKNANKLTAVAKSIAFSPNNKYIAVGYNNGQAGVHSMLTHSFIKIECGIDDEQVGAYVIFSPDNNLIVACGKKITSYEFQEDLKQLCP